MPFTELEFFQAVSDYYEGKIAANVPQARSKPRASSLMNEARSVAYSMANTPKTNPTRDDPHKADSAYTQEQGRVSEDITVAGLTQLGYNVRGRQLCIGHEACEGGTSEGAKVDHWATGHPDALVDLPDGRVALVSFKMFGRFAYGGLWRDGIHKRRDDKGGYAKGMELFAQEVVYGSGLITPPDEVWWMVVSQDASSMRLEFKWKSYAGKNPHAKGFFRAVEWEDLTHLIPTLRARAEWFTNWYETDGDPAHVAWEKPCPENWRDLPATEIFPWGWTEYEDRAVADGPGFLVAPRPLPF